MDGHHPGHAFGADALRAGLGPLTWLRNADHEPLPAPIPSSSA